MLYNIRNKENNEIVYFHQTPMEIATLSSIITDKYVLEEVSDSELIEKPLSQISEKDREKLLDKFKKTLSPAQYNDIRTGKKTIEYQVNLGYFLRINKESSETYISLEHNRHVKFMELFRGNIANYKENIYFSINQQLPIEREEFEQQFAILVNKIK